MFTKTTDMNREKLKQLHSEEDEMNREYSKLEKQIKDIEKKKAKIRKRISHNMKFRNKIINEP